MERAKQKRPLGNYKNLIKMLSKYKQPSLEAGLLIVLVVISIFSMGYYTETPTGMFSKEVTGDMVKVTGMDVKYFVYQNNEWKLVTAPPTTGNYMIETSSGKYLVEDGKYYKLQTGGWDKSKDYINEVKTELTSPPPPQTPTTTPKTTSYYVQDKLGGASIKIDATSETEARKKAVEEFGITPGTITTEPKPTGTRYIVRFLDGTTYPIIAIDDNDANKKGGSLASQLGKTFESASQPKYKVYLSQDVYKEVEASSPSEAITQVKDEYTKQNVIVNPIKTEEITTETTWVDVTKNYVTFVITPKDGAPFTVQAKDITAAQTVANSLITTEKTVEEQKYKITYGDKSYVVTESDRRNEIAALSALGISSYTIKPVTGLEATQQGELKTYRITLVDGTTVNKMFANDNAAQEFVNSLKGTTIMGNNPPAPIHVITIEEAQKVGYRDSGFTLQDGKTPLFTKDGIKFYHDPTTSTPSVYSDTLYKSYEVGDKIKVTEQYKIQEKAVPKFDYATIQGITTRIYDKTTLSEIKDSVGQKGILSMEGDLIVIRKDNQPFQAFKLDNYNPKTESGSKLIYTFQTVYQSGEKVISEQEFNSLSENEKSKYSPVRMVASSKGGEWVQGAFFVTMGKGTIEDGKIIYQEQTFDSEGKIWKFVYGEGTTFENSMETQVTLDNDGNPIGELTQKGRELLSKTRTALSQFKSKRWFADFEFKLTQFRGLAGWSQLIFDKETLAEWREGVDKLFSTFYLGTDYWSSAICSKYIPKQQKGLLTMKTKDGLFDIVAHVEGERTLIPKPDGTKQYIYKLTLAVRNPKYSSYDKLQFNVYLYGEKTVKLYEQDISVEDGKSFTRGTGEMEDGQVTYTQEHGKPIVQYSDFLYNKICIKFTHSITNAEGSSEDEVCNSIVEYKGSPTKYQQRTTPTTPGTQATPGEPYQEADF